MTPIYKELYFLTPGETNAEQQLSLPLLVTRLIDISTAHANSLGIGNPSMTHINGGWILSRLTIEMDSYPNVNSHYSISTWVESTNRHFSTRAFKIEDEDGAVLGYARSIWLVMDIFNHTNLGLSHINIPSDMIPGIEVPIAHQARHVPIVADPDDKSVAKGALVASYPPFIYTFQYSDLDFYRHVNTVRYVNLLVNQFSLEQHDASFVNRLELSFLHEAKYGMQTRLLRSDLESDMHSAFELCDTADSQPILFARVKRKLRH